MTASVPNNVSVFSVYYWYCNKGFINENYITDLQYRLLLIMDNMLLTVCAIHLMFEFIYHFFLQSGSLKCLAQGHLGSVIRVSGN